MEIPPLLPPRLAHTQEKTHGIEIPEMPWEKLVICALYLLGLRQGVRGLSCNRNGWGFVLESPSEMQGVPGWDGPGHLQHWQVLEQHGKCVCRDAGSHDILREGNGAGHLVQLHIACVDLGLLLVLSCWRRRLAVQLPALASSFVSGKLCSGLAA